MCIVSSRSHQPNGTNAMRTWLRKYGAPVDRVTFPDHKPAAFVTIDDRAIQFDGKWPAIDVLKAFKPWNKR